MILIKLFFYNTFLVISTTIWQLFWQITLGHGIFGDGGWFGEPTLIYYLGVKNTIFEDLIYIFFLFLTSFLYIPIIIFYVNKIVNFKIK